MRLGFIFKSKFGVWPETLTKEQRERFIFGDRKPMLPSIVVALKVVNMNVRRMFKDRMFKIKYP